jgi:hypothetical protein
VLHKLCTFGGLVAGQSTKDMQSAASQDRMSFPGGKTLIVLQNKELQREREREMTEEGGGGMMRILCSLVRFY